MKGAFEVCWHQIMTAHMCWTWKTEVKKLSNLLLPNNWFYIYALYLYSVLMYFCDNCTRINEFEHKHHTSMQSNVAQDEFFFSGKMVDTFLWFNSFQTSWMQHSLYIKYEFLWWLAFDTWEPFMTHLLICIMEELMLMYTLANITPRHPMRIFLLWRDHFNKPYVYFAQKLFKHLGGVFFVKL